MSKILMSDNIVRAVADTHPDFLSDRYGICDDILPEYNVVSETLRDNIITNGKINRFALKYDRVMPFLYDEETITQQSVLVFFDIAEDETSRYAPRSSNSNDLMSFYEIYVNIYAHNNLVVTSYSKSRTVFISEEIKKLLENDYLGRNENRSLENVKCRFNRPQALMNGRIHGRNMLFTTTGFDLRC